MSQLFLIQELEPFVFKIFHDCNLIWRAFLHHIKLLIFQPIIDVKIKVFCLFHLFCLLISSMNVTRYQCIEMTDVIVFVLVNEATVVAFFFVCLHKEVGYVLFWHLMVFLCHDILIFWLKHQLALAFVKKTQGRYFQSKGNLIVDCGH